MIEARKVTIWGYQIMCTPLTVDDVLAANGDRNELIRRAVQRIEAVTSPDGMMLTPRDLPILVMDQWISQMGVTS